MASSDAATSTHNPPAASGSKQTITIGTRRSQLARLQTDIVLEALRKAYPQYEYRVHAMDPLGDRDKVTALYRFNNENAKGLWTHELEEMLLAGDLDLIVHSLKDMPTTLPPNLTLGAVLNREDARDALVLKPSALPPDLSPDAALTAHKILSSLPAGSIVGTSSLRRTAQLRRRYPHLAFEDVRGNVPTRLRKLDAPDSFADQPGQAPVPNYAALVLAAAGLTRLGLGHRITAHLHSADGGLLHAVGQGALGIEIRADDDRMRGMLRALADTRAERACLVERSVMRTLEGGCSVPIGVETQWTTTANREDGRSSGGDDGEELLVRAVVVSLDGKDAGEVEERAVVRSPDDAEAFGRRIAALLLERGAAKILDEVNAHRRAGLVQEPGGGLAEKEDGSAQRTTM